MILNRLNKKDIKIYSEPKKSKIYEYVLNIENIIIELMIYTIQFLINENKMKY